MYSKLQYISQGKTSKEHLLNIQSVLDAGCDWIQLRLKNVDILEYESTAKKAKEICDKYKATFIVNDNVLIAKNCDADGVHLGLNDMLVLEARKILGETKIIGGTANTYEDVLKRIDEQCNYIGLGPYKFTNTKSNLSPILGLNGYAAIISKLNSVQKQVPIYAIGGIELQDIEQLFQTGIYGIAVSGLLTNTENRKAIIHQIKNLHYANT